MSSNFVWYCEFCEKRIKEEIKKLYGKVPHEQWERINDALKNGTVKDLLEALPEEIVEKIANGDIDRILHSHIDFDFVEDWGDGIYINEDGNLVVSISCACDMCGKTFNYEIILPENIETKVIDLTKKEGGIK